MVVQMLADTGKAVFHCDAMRCQMVRIADSRQLQDLR